MVTKHREIEEKFLIDGSTPPIPDLLAELRNITLGDRTLSELEATYFDTPDRQLTRRGITLRRRAGGDDGGWHLKVPSGNPHTRFEFQLPADGTSDAIPAEVLDRVRAFVRDQPVEPIATIHTDRTEIRLLEHDDDVAVVADDRVRARRSQGGGVDVQQWHEIEIEMTNGSAKLLRRCRRHLRDAGIDPSPFPSKLHHALGRHAVETASAAAPASDAGGLALAYLRTQVDELLHRDWGARQDEPDAVHKMRVTTRRIRSALAAFRPVLDRAATDPIRGELKWLGAILGEVRDAEVQRERLLEAAESVPSELRIGPVEERINHELAARHRRAHARLVEALNSARYLRLLDRLDALLADPPFTDRARRSAGDRARKIWQRSRKRVTKRRRRATEVEDATARDARLHEVRKAAKKVRYTSEAVEPALGKKATQEAKRMKKEQDLLGELQDTVASRLVLEQLATVAHANGESTFTYGLLYGQQVCAAERAASAYLARHD